MYYWPYIRGTIWLITILAISYGVGRTFCRFERSGPFRIVYGYVIFSLGPAIWGLLVRVLNGEWIIYKVFMFLWLALSLTVILLNIHRYPLNLTRDAAVHFFENYRWLLLIFALVIFFTTILYPQFWCGNHSDDGYYISLLTSTVSDPTPFEVNPSSGIRGQFTIDSYSVNSYLLEQAFFCQLFAVPPTIFTRIFGNIFGLLQYGFCIYSCTATTFALFGIKNRYNNTVQFSVSILILLTINSAFLINTDLFTGYDLWQNTTAMYYGSSYVRTCGYMYLLLPFIDQFRFNRDTVWKVAGISIFLITRSTIALPVVFIACIGYSLTYVAFRKKNGLILVTVALLILGLFGSCMNSLLSFKVIDLTATPFENSLSNLFLDRQSIVLVFAEGILLLSVFLRRIRVWRIVFMIFLFYLLQTVPIFNIIALDLSVYEFVVLRSIASLASFTVCIGYAFLLALLVRNSGTAKIVKSAGVGIICIYGVMDYYAFRILGGNAALEVPEVAPTTVTEALLELTRNPAILQEEVLQTGRIINSLGNKDCVPIVVTPYVFYEDGNMDILPVLLKTEPGNSLILTANCRFPQVGSGRYEGYSVARQAVVDAFLNQPDENTFNEFLTLVGEYDINVLVTPDMDLYDPWMSRLGFSMVGTAKNGQGYGIYRIYTSLES